MSPLSQITTIVGSYFKLVRAGPRRNTLGTPVNMYAAGTILRCATCAAAL